MQRAQQANPALEIVWIGSQDERANVVKMAKELGLGGPLVYDDGAKLNKELAINAGAGLVTLSREGKLRVKINRPFGKKQLHAALAASFPGRVTP